MSPKRPYVDYLEDMIEAANNAVQFVEGVTYDEFVKNTEKVYAVTRALEIIGEAAAHIPESVQAQQPEIPWSDVIGMRNILIHGYFNVDLEVIWKSIHQDMPELVEHISALIDDTPY